MDKQKRNIVILFKGWPYKEDVSLSQSRVSLIPLSLISVAAPLRDAGYTVKIIDQRHSIEDIYQMIQPLLDQVLCVGVSALTSNEITAGIAFSRKIKEVCPEIPIVWGGWHVSILPEESIKDPNVDIILKGIGQNTFLNLVEAISRQERDFSSLPGVYFKCDGKIVKTKDEQNGKMDVASLPAFELLDLEYYRLASLRLRPKPVIDGLNITGYLYYVTSFGCPHSCAYCCNDILFKRRSYGYPIEKVVDQIKFLVEEKGFNSIGFMDANFFVNVNRVERFCLLILEKGIRFAWDAQMHVDDILRYEKRGLFKLVRDSGCFRVNIGSESGSQEVLDYINKKIRVEETLESARILKNYDIEASFNFLFGLPRLEDIKQVHESIKLAVDLKRINPNFSLPVSFYIPFPGTSMYRDALERGLKVPDSLKEWGVFDTAYDGSGYQNYPWRRKSLDKLIKDAFFFYIPLAVPGNMCRGTLTRVDERLKSSKLRFFIRIGHWLAKWRVKHSFYRFPFETHIFRMYAAVRKSSTYIAGGKAE